MILRPCVLQRFTSDPRRSGKQKPTCRPLIKTRQLMALEEMNNISRLKRKKGLKRKITQNEIRRTADALQRTHFALRAEKRAKRKRKRKRNPDRVIADEKLAGLDLSAASQPVSKSFKRTDSITRNAFLSAAFISSMIIFCHSDSLGKGL